MKFEQLLFLGLVSEWRACYINYNLLKRIIDAITASPHPQKEASLIALFNSCLRTQHKIVLTFYSHKWRELTRNHQLSLEITLCDLPEDRKEEYKQFLRSVFLQSNYMHNFIQLNSEGFRKIVKKFKKEVRRHPPSDTQRPALETVESVDEVVARTTLTTEAERAKKMIEQVEDRYAELVLEDEDTPVKESRNYLRRLVNKEQLNQNETFIFGVYVGFTLIIILVIIISSLEVESLGSHTFFKDIFPVMRGSALFVFYMWLLCLDVYFWVSHNINHRNIFKLGAEVTRLPVLLMRAAGFSVAWVICTLFWLLLKLRFTEIGKIPVPFQSVDYILIVPWCLFLLVMLMPLDVCGRDGRVILFKVFFKALFSPCFHHSFAVSWLTDQLISLLNPFKDFYYMICFYSNAKTFCQAKLNFLPNLLLGSLFSVMRILQCMRTGYDQGKYLCTPHFYNTIKYAIGIVTQIFSFFFSTNRRLLGPWIFFASLNTIYSFIWDIRFDWDLLQMDSKRPLLRDQLTYRSSLYYFIIAVNLVLRFAWVLSISPEIVVAFNITPVFFSMLVAALELVRRCLWNFLRVQKEHLANCRSFNAIRLQPFQLQPLEEPQDIPEQQQLTGKVKPVKDDSSGMSLVHLEEEIIMGQEQLKEWSANIKGQRDQMEQSLNDIIMQ